jgi:hypothetical protein
MTAMALRPGIWALKDGGSFLRTRLLDPRSGKFVEYQRVLRDVTLNQAERERYRLRCDARDLASGRKQAPMLWSAYAASLFESKTNEGKIQSAKGREKWAITLRRLIPAFGHFYVDELRLAHLIAWRNDVARWRGRRASARAARRPSDILAATRPRGARASSRPQLPSTSRWHMESRIC